MCRLLRCVSPVIWKEQRAAAGQVASRRDSGALCCFCVLQLLICRSCTTCSRHSTPGSRCYILSSTYTFYTPKRATAAEVHGAHGTAPATCILQVFHIERALWTEKAAVGKGRTVGQAPLPRRGGPALSKLSPETPTTSSPFSPPFSKGERNTTLPLQHPMTRKKAASAARKGTHHRALKEFLKLERR